MGYKLFDFPYAIWDESKREEIQQKFADYYMFREICVDSPEYFKHLFKSRWQVHWPYFNELYKSTELKYNPLTTHYESEQESQGRDLAREETEAKLGTACRENRVTDAKTSHQLVVGTLDETVDGTEDETTHRFLDQWEKTDEHVAGTLDSKVDSTENMTENSHTEGVKDTEGHLEKDVVGNSKRVTDTDSHTTTTGHTTHSDYPQANLAAVSPENPGIWATWAEDSKGTSDTNTHGTETIDSTENTNQNTTEHQTYSEDYDHTKDTVGNVTTDQDTTQTTEKTVHHTEDENTMRDLDTKDVTDQDTTETTDIKSFENEIGKTHSNTKEANSSQSNEKEKKDKVRTVSGYADKSPQELLILYRQAIINIDKQLIDTFAPLFMGVY